MIDHVPGVPTVSWVEAGWVVAALVSLAFARSTRCIWRTVSRRLTHSTDRGARIIAGMLDACCTGLVAASLLNIVASVPALVYPPRPDVVPDGDDRFLLLLAPLAFIALALGIVAISIFLAVQTRRLGISSDRGPGRRGPPDPRDAGPRRRVGDRKPDHPQEDGALDVGPPL